MRAALAVLVLLLGSPIGASPAAAQGRIVETRGDAAPFHLSGTVLGPIEEGAALVVFGQDISDRSARAIRADASGVQAGPGIDPMRVAAIARCGTTRWLLELEIRARRYRYALRPEGGAIAWSAEMPDDSVPQTTLRCAGSEPRVAYLSGGELVLASRDGSESRVRVMPPGPRGEAQRGELRLFSLEARVVLALVAPWDRSVPTELLRIEGNTITRRAPTDAQDLFVLDATRALAARTETDGALSLRIVSTVDLQTLATARIAPPEAQHSLRLAGAWASPSGPVVIATTDHWLDGWVSIPQGPSEPDRYEPAEQSAAALRTLDPTTGALGPELSLGSRYSAVGAFLGPELVLFEGVEPTGVSGGVVQLRGARIRRFRLAP